VSVQVCVGECAGVCSVSVQVCVGERAGVCTVSHECVRAHVYVVPKLLIGVSFNQTITICVMCHEVFMFLTWSCQ